MSASGPSAEGFSSAADRVLLLCHANRCRSPLAGAIFVREVQLHNLNVEVRTAGFSPEGMPATSATVDIAADLGLDLRSHASRAVSRAMLEGADLVLGMERLHVREAVVLEPSVWPHAFTLPEIVRRAELVAPREPGEPLRTWLELLSLGRDRQDLLGTSPDDEVRDPTTDWTVDHATTAVLIDDLVKRLVSRAWPA